MVAFCQQEGLSSHNFYYWRRKLGATAVADAPVPLLPVQLLPHPQPLSGHLFSFRNKNADRTTVKLRVPGLKKTKKAHLWTAIGDADYPYVVFFAEYFGLFTRHYFSPGVHYLVTEDVEVGVRMGWGLNDQTPRYFVNAGFGVRF